MPETPKKKLWKFTLHCGRMGTLSGIFTATQEEVDEKLMNKRIYFGEVLGKHSEIVETLTSEHLKVLTDDQDFIEKFQKFECASGKNPLHYADRD
jgi:hypothetical protein